MKRPEEYFLNSHLFQKWEMQSETQRLNVSRETGKNQLVCEQEGVLVFGICKRSYV